MRPRAYLDFVRDRVLAEIRATPPTGPLLTELPPPTTSRPCKRGHDTGRYRDGQCIACKALRDRRPRP
jgi:hypothetical protein